ncbi:MAG: 50S ribosomal protein L25 [Alphaproteobacteria bacterium MarineAlpha8_Bin1]|nr:MAG: 50S ribosomal protein L25 [Alphaproteobacteria bacterium MarineAlpha8_Bin1]|tara:strand:+ start:506 stop:1222 length:717 start_codon:yes stop_codon:yes gene_type:complete
MTELFQIEAEKRTLIGKGNSRANRNQGKIPGIIYGEKKDPILITVEQKKLKMAIENAGFFSKQCEIKIDNDVFKVLPKDLQLHPVKESIIHIDFLRVGENTMLTIFVPVKFINENKCDGIKQGGVLNVVRREIEIKAPIQKLPEFIEADLEGLDIGDSIHISSVKLSDEVVPTIKDRDFTIATIAQPTVMKVEEEVKVDDAQQEVEGEQAKDSGSETKEEVNEKKDDDGANKEKEKST